jgi:very-short-patch-repair endonuclease
MALQNRPGVSKTGASGSKAEIYFYERLAEELPYQVRHHDRDLVPGYEVDVTIPTLRIAIEWHGRAHREPIFGEHVFIRRLRADAKKKRLIEAKGWRYIVIHDTNRDFDVEFVEEQVRIVLTLIDSMS